MMLIILKIINHLIPQKYLEWIENLMEFDIDTGEWYIANLAEVGLGNKDIPVEGDASHILAMGFHDDEERKKFFKIIIFSIST